jgi:hypothetical protein
VNVWVVSDVGSLVLVNSVPTGEPATYAWAPRVAVAEALSTFHSTLTVTRSSVTEPAVGMPLQSNPSSSTVKVVFLPGAAVAYVSSEAYALAAAVQPASFAVGASVTEPEPPARTERPMDGGSG